MIGFVIVLTVITSIVIVPSAIIACRATFFRKEQDPWV